MFINRIFYMVILQMFFGAKVILRFFLTGDFFIYFYDMKFNSESLDDQKNNV